MLKQFLMSYASNWILMKRNLDWHRKVLALSLPFAFVGMIVFAEYLVLRLKRSQE